jgi:hypothetical protein
MLKLCDEAVDGRARLSANLHSSFSMEDIPLRLIESLFHIRELVFCPIENSGVA